MSALSNALQTISVGPDSRQQLLARKRLISMITALMEGVGLLAPSIIILHKAARQTWRGGSLVTLIRLPMPQVGRIHRHHQPLVPCRSCPCKQSISWSDHQLMLQLAPQTSKVGKSTAWTVPRPPPLPSRACSRAAPTTYCRGDILLAICPFVSPRWGASTVTISPLYPAAAAPASN